MKKQEAGMDRLLGELKKKNIRLTGPRRAILRAFVENHGPFSAEDVYKRFVRATCDLATVYRTLTSLEEATLLRRCEFGDGTTRYELKELDRSHHHHHLICKVCKKIETLDDCEAVIEMEKMVRKRGFAEVSHLLEFFGVCPACQ